MAIHPPGDTRSEKWIFNANLLRRLTWIVPDIVTVMNAVGKHQITAIAGVALLVSVLVTVSEEDRRFL